MQSDDVLVKDPQQTAKVITTVKALLSHLHLNHWQQFQQEYARCQTFLQHYNAKPVPSVPDIDAAFKAQLFEARDLYRQLVQELDKRGNALKAMAKIKQKSKKLDDLYR